MIRNNFIHNLYVVLLIYNSILLKAAYRFKLLPVHDFPLRSIRNKFSSHLNRNHLFQTLLYSFVNIDSVFEGDFNESNESLVSLQLGSIDNNTKLDHSKPTNISFHFDYRTITPETVVKSLEMMKLADLKLYLRHLGGKSSRGKKAEILERCHSIISLANSTNTRTFFTAIGDNNDENEVHELSENVIQKLQSKNNPILTKPSHLGTVPLKNAIEQKALNNTKTFIAQSYGDRYRANTSTLFSDNFTKVSNSKGSSRLSKKLSMKPYDEVDNLNSNSNDNENRNSGTFSHVKKSRFAFPVGQLRNTRFDNSTHHGGDMDLTFLGE